MNTKEMDNEAEKGFLRFEKKVEKELGTGRFMICVHHMLANATRQARFIEELTGYDREQLLTALLKVLLMFDEESRRTRLRMEFDKGIRAPAPKDL